MSEKEFNEKVRANRKERTTGAITAAAWVLGKALAFLLAAVILWAVNFITMPFLALLAGGAVCWTAFRVGAVFGRMG